MLNDRHGLEMGRKDLKNEREYSHSPNTLLLM